MAVKKTPRARAPRAAVIPAPTPVLAEAADTTVVVAAPVVAPVPVIAAPVVAAPVAPEVVRVLARQIWERDGGPALDNWLAAERQLRGEMAAPA